MKNSLVFILILITTLSEAQVPGTPMILRDVRPIFTSSIELNGSSTTSVIYNIKITDNGTTPVSECGFYYSYNTAYIDPLLDQSVQKAIVGYNNNSNLPITGNISHTFLIAPYYFIAYVKNTSGTYFGTKTILAPNWPTVTFGGRTWAAANLGSSSVASSITDANSYGWYYQWGRGSDGHQLSSSTLTTTTSSSVQPDNSFFINNANNWLNTNNNVLWNGINGVNNPCPPLYRVATEGDWSSNYDNLASSTAGYNSTLKLTSAGYRNPNGSLGEVGTRAFYFTSTPFSTYNAYRVDNLTSYYFASYNGTRRSSGTPIRCILN